VAEILQFGVNVEMDLISKETANPRCATAQHGKPEIFNHAILQDRKVCFQATKSLFEPIKLVLEQFRVAKYKSQQIDQRR
jgi:hypothetical protein